MWKIRKTVSKGDYTYAVVPEHPNSNKHGYVLEHRIIMENSLSRLLKSNEVVHHKDGDKKNNSLSNLELMDIKEHTRLHSSKGRKVATLKCPYCNNIFKRFHNNTHLVKGGIATFCSRSCRGKFFRFAQLYGKTPEMILAIEENVVEVFLNKLIKTGL